MSRTLKIAAVVVAIVALLTLVLTGTVYAVRGGLCGSGDSCCAQQHRGGCIGSGGCDRSGNCNQESPSDAGNRP
jgi:hypothetical protein